jgi:cell division protein FtsA
VARKERYLVGLDVGTSKIAAIVGEMTDNGGLDIIGMGLADSRGIRRGVVVNLEAAVEAIKKAIEEAELTAGVEIDFVHLGLSGAHVKAFNSRGVVAVAGRNREITREDVKRAVDAARAVALPVTTWTLTSSRAPVMPTGAPIPSCSSTTKSCGRT